ncbi:hypothetical protein PsorP6_017739 [Peronosclerospora sorghi]|uniref:Uncharacterized protein n=1 Tax=Peronosclerospora sorghi TaxID=230839 RepID=A0ACC0WN36_9STRA|nr:hypothetical protein PsorP6_017739 [Peronosclerospora sorghi]
METQPFRQTRQPRRNLEVIIIEEDDDMNKNQGAQDCDVLTSMISSPPDIISDKEGASEAVAYPAAALIDTRNTTAFETADLLQKEK